MHPSTHTGGGYMCTNLDPTCREHLLAGRFAAALGDAIGAANSFSYTAAWANDNVLTCDYCDKRVRRGDSRIRCYVCTSFVCKDHSKSCEGCGNGLCSGHMIEAESNGRTFSCCPNCAPWMYLCLDCGRHGRSHSRCVSCDNLICKYCNAARHCHYRNQHWDEKDGSSRVCPSCVVGIRGRYTCPAHASRLIAEMESYDKRRKEMEERRRRQREEQSELTCRQLYCIHRLPNNTTRPVFSQDMRTRTGWAYDCDSCKDHRRMWGYFRTPRQFQRMAAVPRQPEDARRGQTGATAAVSGDTFNIRRSI
jgi:hypothetical protein